MVGKNRWNIVFQLFILAGCATSSPDALSPQESYEDARRPYDIGNYEIAIKRLGEFKSRFPYSRFAKEAELLIANAHFAMKNYVEASLAYDSFVRLHPKHPKIPFVLYRIGLSYWRDAPESVDREQEFTAIAIDKWQNLLNDYPDALETRKAAELIKVGRRRLARADQFVANFYCRQEIWHACAYRNEKIIERHKNYPEIVREALQKAAKAFHHLAILYGQDSKKDKNVYYKSMSKAELEARAHTLEKRLRHHSAGK